MFFFDPQQRSQNYQKQLYEKSCRDIQALLKDQKATQVYILSKGWLQQWKQFVNYSNILVFNQQPVQPSIMNSDLINDTEEQYFKYVQEYGCWNLKLHKFTELSDFQIVCLQLKKVTKELYDELAKEYKSSGEITRQAIYDPNQKQLVIEANLLVLEIFYNVPGQQVKNQLIQIDKNEKVQKWRDVIYLTFVHRYKALNLQDIRIWKCNKQAQASETIAKQLQTTKSINGIILSDKTIINEIEFVENDYILIDFRQSDQWQYTVVDKKCIMKDNFQQLFQRMSEGCGRGICQYDMCKSNPDYQYKSLVKEQIATIAIQLLTNNPQITMNICQRINPIKVLSIDDILPSFKQLDYDTIFQQLSAVSQSIDTFGCCFSLNNQYDESPQLDYAAIEILNSICNSDQKKANEIVGLWGQNLYRQRINHKDPIDNIYSLRALFIITSLRLFNENLIANQAYFQLLELLSLMNEYYKEQLILWYATLDAPVFIEIHSFIKSNIVIYLLNHLEDLTLPFASLLELSNFRFMMDYYELIYRSNQLNPRIRPVDFKIDILTQVFTKNSDRQQFTQFEAYKLQKWDEYYFSFCKYPFAVPTQLKSKLLQTDIWNQQQQNMMVNANQFMQIPFLTIIVDRQNIEKSVLDQLALAHSYKKPLKVVFKDEMGIDEGGVRKELFVLLSNTLFNENRKMFTLKNQNTILWFNQKADVFEPLGVILGLALYNSTLLDLRFPQIIYKKLLNESIKLDDLKEVDPQLYEGLIKLKNYQENDIEEAFSLTFEIYCDVTQQKMALKQGGASINVNQNNKLEFIDLYVKYYANQSIKKQFDQFQKGFYKVMGGNAITLFTGEELQELIVGEPDFDIKELQSVTKYQNYLPNEEYIIRFWEILSEFPKAEQRRFLLFCTGTDRIPVGGLRTMKFMIQKHGDLSEQLPSAHTCFNVLLLPKYDSIEKLKQKLIICLANSEGFGLM